MNIEIKLKPTNLGINHNKFIFQKINYVSTDICKSLRNFIDTTDGAHVRGSKNPSLWKANFSTCLLMDQTYEIYEIVKTALIEYNSLHNFSLSFMEVLEIKKYNINDFFEPHVDNFFGTALNEDRKLNVIVQLSHEQDYDGGELYVGINKFQISKAIGTITIFPANYLHQVSKVTNGIRYSLIGHVWGPEFK